MALHEFEPRAQPQPQLDQFEIRTCEVDDIPFSHLGRKIKEHYVAMNGSDLGQLHLDESQDEHIAVSDGFYPEPDKEDITLSDQQWQLLALKLYSSGATKARRIKYPGGQRVLLEAI